MRQRKYSIPRIFSFITLLIFLVIWEVAAQLDLVSSSFFPPPSKIFITFFTLLSDGTLVLSTGSTLFRFISGVFVGSVIGATLGLIMGWWRPLNAYLSPWINAFYPIPKIAIFPLLLVIFGIGERSKFIAIFLGAFFPMVITTINGVQQISRIYFEVGKNYGIRGYKVFSHILLPGSLPSIMTGLRLAVNSGFVIAISVEVISARDGLGVLLWYGWQTFRVADLFAALIVISVLGIMINYLLEKIMIRMIPWMGE